jgi:hypothetical protein
MEKNRRVAIVFLALASEREREKCARKGRRRKKFCATSTQMKMEENSRS